uniref:Uncharacterized protein n=1 Tax=Physcomitrium patens TaxID=3218 RepID=A0A2K1IZM5_PHYPA|nr:hypothetical protein PHYPA_022632 [Physcomitrium patens]
MREESTIPDNEAILTLIRSLPLSYRSFISSLRRQPEITLTSLITGFDPRRNTHEKHEFNI